ncbi:MAG: hypothetical protein ACW964_19275, partial [Candidatus Hodarchaeales archaeon]
LGKVPWFVKIGADAGNIVNIDPEDYLEYDSRGQYITGYVDQFYNSVFWALYTAEVASEQYTNYITQYGPIKDNTPEIQGFSEEYAEYADYYELAYKSAHDWVFIWKIRWDIIPPGAIAP